MGGGGDDDMCSCGEVRSLFLRQGVGGGGLGVLL